MKPGLTPLQWTPHIGTYNTPDDYSNYPPTGVNYFNGVTSGGSEANFYNTNDFALRWWVTESHLVRAAAICTAVCTGLPS